MIVSCEELCQSLNKALPAGHPLFDEHCVRCRVETTSAGDLGTSGSCFEKFCRPTPEGQGCPNQGFLDCVKENSALQLGSKPGPEVPALLKDLSSLQRAVAESVHAMPGRTGSSGSEDLLPEHSN